MSKEIVYMAGPLFTEYEFKARQKEAEVLQNTFPKWEIFAPVNAPFNGKNPTNMEIFQGDNEAVQKSTVFLVDLNNNDSGTMMELGMAVQKKINGEDVEIVGYLWDLRMNRPQGEDKFDRPLGFNGFVVGGIQKYGKLFEKFDDALEYLKKKYK
ncbi:MAG: nucleoside 2-deoxyribosyltransferase [Mycoplasma sp.]|nr:nucleoside 2-deoxyribosyltransferase [Mycoplasma sp.]